MPTQEVQFQNKKSHILSGMVRYPDSLGEDIKYPAVIVLHDFAAHSNHEYIINTANFILPYRYVVLRFDFHGHGESGGDFHDLTISQQVNDVESAINYLETLDFVDKDKIGIFGHGMGADVAILAAAKDKRINCLVIHAARTNLEHHATKRFSESELLEIKMKGFINHPIHGKINHHFFDHLRRFDPLEEIKKISIPIFITHGKNDFQVPFAESKQLFFKANDPKYLDILDDADHEFRNPEHREHFYNMMIEWFNRYLRDKKA